MADPRRTRDIPETYAGHPRDIPLYRPKITGRILEKIGYFLRKLIFFEKAWFGYRK